MESCRAFLLNDNCSSIKQQMLSFALMNSRPWSMQGEMDAEHTDWCFFTTPCLYWWGIMADWVGVGRGGYRRVIAEVKANQDKQTDHEHTTPFLVNICSSAWIKKRTCLLVTWQVNFTGLIFSDINTPKFMTACYNRGESVFFQTNTYVSRCYHL